MCDEKCEVSTEQQGLTQGAEELSPICRRAFLKHAARAAMGLGLAAGTGALSGCLGFYGYADFSYGDYGNYGDYGDYYNYGNYGNYADYVNYADYGNWRW